MMIVGMFMIWGGFIGSVAHAVKKSKAKSS
ncbi:hypothetical protein EDD69_11259 [Thermolongibacillus altinsuensis]|uniref:Uncharacterized protein n=1 Tax=Thermolongibacillus altinsuensis TaxID=575256 RepID=A0A4R1QD42_9BACL|nr:MetS family NSS transporter small subunit [Thermolongibacillus altinsuensis]TCL47349.1 hypothetical protein EDD69_11259 [Thermolongibacillus altinsuensis]